MDSSSFPEDFSSDAVSYARSIEAWRRLLVSVLVKWELHKRWVEWFEPVSFNSPLGIDGSPICSLIDKCGAKGVLVFALAKECPLDFSCYMEIKGDSALGSDPIQTLVLHSKSTNVEKARALFEDWVSGKYTFEEMKHRGQ